MIYCTNAKQLDLKCFRFDRSFCFVLVVLHKLGTKPFKTHQLGDLAIPVKQIATFSFPSRDKLEFCHVSALLHQALAEA